MRMRLLLVALLLLLCGPARAQDSVLTGTLKTIHDRGTILLGVRESSIPFSYLNKARQPIGFSVDLCRGIAADVAAALHADLLEPDAPAWQKGVRIIYVPVASDERLAKVISGAIDLECGSTTATEERAKTVAFSPVFFLAGTKLLVRKDGGIASYRDLGGKTVVASAGTTNGDAMKRLAARGSPAFSVVEAPDLPAAYDTLAAGKAVAFASDAAVRHDCDAAGRQVVPRGGGLSLVRAIRDHVAAQRSGFRRSGEAKFWPDGGGGHAARALQPLADEAVADRGEFESADQSATGGDVSGSGGAGLSRFESDS